MRTHWLVLAMLIGTADRASACSCPAVSPCGAFDRTAAVFLGEVVDVRREGLQLVARLEVSRVWKGTVDRVATVTNQAGTSCSFDFRVGEQYVIYGTHADGTFRTNVCAGGGLLRTGTPEPDLPPVPGRVTGRVARYKEPLTDRENTTTPIPDVRVWIDTGAGVLEARSDADGKFALDGVPKGEHVVHADLGSAFAGSDRITMHSSTDCAHALVIAAPSGRLSGTLTSRDGTPIRDMEIHAVPIGHDWTKHDLSDVRTSRTNEDGAFEFRGVKPGQYVLGVNVFEPPRVAQPFPPTYYPGVENREDATLVTVGEGETAPPEPFVLPRTLPLTSIVATITCQDGSTPNPGMVYGIRADGRSYLSEVTYPPVNGRYRLTVMEDVSYLVHGVLFVRGDASGRDSGAVVRTPNVLVDASTPGTTVRLVAPLERCEATTADGNRPP